MSDARAVDRRGFASAIVELVGGPMALLRVVRVVRPMRPGW